MRRFIIVAAALLSFMLSTTANACTIEEPEIKNDLIKLKWVICSLAGQSVQLMKELRKELIDESVNTTEVSCTSVVLGDKYTRVGQLRVPPFNCKIGGKYLVVNGDVLTYDSRGRAGPRPRNARYLVLSNPKWSWR